MSVLKGILAAIYMALIALLLCLSTCDSNLPPQDPKPKMTPSPVPPLVQEPEPEPVPEPISEPVPEPVPDPRGIGGSGDLKVTLMWNFLADLDLHIVEPDGNHIFYGNKRNEHSTGFLDVDNREGGTGAAENVYWEHVPQGAYEIRVKYYGHAERSGVAESGEAVVYVIYANRTQEYRITMNNVGQEVAVLTMQII